MIFKLCSGLSHPLHLKALSLIDFIFIAQVVVTNSMRPICGFVKSTSRTCFCHLIHDPLHAASEIGVERRVLFVARIDVSIVDFNHLDDSKTDDAPEEPG